MFRSQAAAFVAFCTLGTAALAAPQDDVTMHLERVGTPLSTIAQIEAHSGTVSTSQFYDDGVDIATIINLGKEIWKIIEDNRPVVDITYDYATALPRGVTSAEDLDSFSDLQHQSWRIYGTNGFGMTVFDVTYTVVHQYGGSYDGKGKYLATVSIIPSDVQVLWGYTFNMGVKRISTLNVGTREAPVGSITMELQMTVSTVIKHETSTTLFQFRGDSAGVLATDQ